MFKKIKEKLYNFIEAQKEMLRKIAWALTLSMPFLPMQVQAGGGYTGPINALKSVLITIAGAAGVILVIYGVIRFAISFQKMDQNGEHSAVYTIIAGGILIGAGVVLTALGV